MKNFIKTIISAIQKWTKTEIKKVQDQIKFETIKVVIDENTMTANYSSTEIQKLYDDGHDVYLEMYGEIIPYTGGYDEVVIFTTTYVEEWISGTYGAIIFQDKSVEFLDYQNESIQSDWNETNTDSKAYIHNKPDVALQSDLNVANNNISALRSNITDLQSEMIAPKDSIIFSENGVLYKLQVKNGDLALSLVASLDDFTYTKNSDGTYTITDWKQTYMGEPSTILVVPDDSNLIL